MNQGSPSQTQKQTKQFSNNEDLNYLYQFCSFANSNLQLPMETAVELNARLNRLKNLLGVIKKVEKGEILENEKTNDKTTDARGAGEAS